MGVAASVASAAGSKSDLRIKGDPASANGATWTYSDSTYALEGVLFKPTGKGPFPAVLVNHGTGGNAFDYGRAVGRIMVRWGYVVIAPHYTHSSGVPCGRPGVCEAGADWGASAANLQRGLKTVELLERLDSVDTSAIMLFGHSRGAFVTTALAAADPTLEIAP